MVKIADVIIIERKKTPLKYIPYLEIGDVDIVSKNYILKDKPSTSGAIFASKGDILVSTVRPTRGAITIVKDDLISVSSAFAKLTVNENVCISKFLFYTICNEHFLKYLGKHSKGATYPTCSIDDIYNYEFELPNIEKQKQIVSELDELFALINMYNANLVDIEKYEVSTFIDLFGNPIENSKGLPMEKLENLGKWTSGGTPSRKVEGYFNGDINWFTAGELNNIYLTDSVEKITSNAINESSAKIFKKNSLLIGMYDTAAFKMGILTKNSSSNQACANLEPNCNVNILWAYYCFKIMKPFFLSKRRGVRQKNLSLILIKSFEVPFPEKNEQDMFSEIIRNTIQLKNEINSNLEDLKKLLEIKMNLFFISKYC